MREPTGKVTSRQRILLAFAHEQADRIPVFDVVNNPEVFSQYLGYQNPFSAGAPTVQLARKLGLDAAMVPVSSYTGLIPTKEHWTGPDSFKDFFGVGYTVSDSSWPLGIAVKEPTLDERFLHVIRKANSLPIDIQSVQDAIAAAHTGDSEELALFAGIRSAFSFLTISGGLVAVSLLIYEDPDLLHELVEAATDYWTQVGLRLIEAGADALYVANDMGMNGSTLISPTHLREFFLPAFARQCATWREAGGRVILHSCGNIMAILSDLSQMAIDGLNNLQSHAGMDIELVKRCYGAKWTIIGNVDATTVMTSIRKEDIEEAIVSVIRTASEGGGLILATDHSFHKGIPLENVIHFIQKAKELGTYPLRVSADSPGMAGGGA